MPYHNKAFRQSEAEFLSKSRNILKRQQQLSRFGTFSDLEKLRVNMVAIDSSSLMRNMRGKFSMSIDDLSSNYQADKERKPSVEELVQKELNFYKSKIAKQSGKQSKAILAGGSVMREFIEKSPVNLRLNFGRQLVELGSSKSAFNLAQSPSFKYL
jgi:hypothetical protein